MDVEQREKKCKWEQVGSRRFQRLIFEFGGYINGEWRLFMRCLFDFFSCFRIFFHFMAAGLE